MLYCRSSTSCRSRMSSVAEPRSLASRQAAVMRSSTKSSATCKNICGLVRYCTVDQTQGSLQRIACVVCVQQGLVRRGAACMVAVTRQDDSKREYSLLLLPASTAHLHQAHRP